MKLAGMILPFTASLCLSLSLVPQTSDEEKTNASKVAERKPGVVVETAAKNSAGERAGLQEGDAILRWSRGGSSGEIESPFDIAFIEIEEAPRGSVTLEGVRGTEKRSWLIGPGDWGMKTRPNLPQDLLSIYLEGQELAKAGKLAQAADRWRRVADKGQKGERSWLRSWLLFHIADWYARARQWEATDAAYQAVLREQGTPAGVRVQLLRSWAESFHERGDPNNAEKHYREALDQDEDEKMRDGNLAGQKARHDSACDDCDLTLQECAGQVEPTGNNSNPASLDAAVTINALGLLAKERGDLVKAKEYHCRALLMQEKLAPRSLPVVRSLINLGFIVFTLGDLSKAEAYDVRALDIGKKLAPEGLEVAAGLNALGSLALRRGDLIRAEEYYRQSLVIQKKLAPGSLQVAYVLNNLGGVAEQQDDFAKAEEYFRQALLIKEKLNPGNPENVFAFLNLGEAIQNQGDLKRSEGYYLQALALAKRSTPGGLYVAASLTLLGSIATERGEYAKVEEYAREALEIEHKIFTDNVYIANLYDQLGYATGGRGDLAAAEEYYRKALAIQEKLIPDQTDYAESLAALAGIMRRKQQPDEAARLYEQALNVLENQIAVLGGTEEVHTGFRARRASYYKDCIDLLLTEKQPELAFGVLERSRARTLLEILNAAHIDIRRGVDPLLLQQEQSLRKSIAGQYQRRIQLLSDKHTEEQVAALDKEINYLDAQYQEVERQIRADSPNYAALTQPKPLSAKEVQEHLLDNDTLLLEYSLGEQRSYLFAVTPSSLNSYELPGRAEIDSKVKQLYDLLSARNHLVQGESAQTRQARVAKADANYLIQASALSRILLGPVAEQLGKKRLLIVNDGALNHLPFAALPLPTVAEKSSAPLIVDHELLNLPSASVLTILRRQRAGTERPTREVAVMADPVFDKYDPRVKPVLTRHGTSNDRSGGNQDHSSTIAGSDFTKQLTRSLADFNFGENNRLHLPRLPFTRREAAGILSATPTGQGRQALDFEANREFATGGQLAQYRIVHFATHALVDDQHPQLSGLVLSMVDERGKPLDGFLELQDIYNLNLAADLVVLSGCDTALGKQVEGEGVIGLTRGFMYAGASRVVSSLWKVDDFATAKLMTSFYGFMEKDGMRPAAALRAAQLELWKQKHWTAPYYWAGFTLQGEWK